MKFFQILVTLFIFISVVSCVNTEKEIRNEINAGIKDNNKSKFKEAIVHYQKVIEIDNKNAEAYLNMGNSYFNLRKYDKSMQCADKAVEYNSTYGEAYKLRGELYKKVFKDNDKACYNYLLAEKYGVKNISDYTKRCK